MQTFSDNPSAAGRPSAGGGALPVLAGAAVACAAVGAALALADLDSPVRVPLALFALLATPAGATAAALRGLEPWARAVAAVAAAVAVNLLVAQAMLALHMWSVRGGIAAVAAVSALVVVPAALRHARRARRSSAAPPGQEGADGPPGPNGRQRAHGTRRAGTP